MEVNLSDIDGIVRGASEAFDGRRGLSRGRVNGRWDHVKDIKLLFLSRDRHGCNWSLVKAPNNASPSVFAPNQTPLNSLVIRNQTAPMNLTAASTATL